MNSKFQRWYLVGAAIIVGVSVIIFQIKDPKSTQSNAETGRLQAWEMSIVVPPEWTMSYSLRLNGKSTYYLRSPDYQEPRPGCKIGGYCNLPAQGTEITLRIGDFYNDYASASIGKKPYEIYKSGKIKSGRNIWY